MSEPKPLASLSSSLLARKGQARPAMRPHGFHLPQAQPNEPAGHGHETGHDDHDDLGWNDMGHDHHPAPIAPKLTPLPKFGAQPESEAEEADEEMAAEAAPVETPIAAPAPVLAPVPAPAPVEAPLAAPVPVPPVVAQQEELARAISSVGHVRTASIVKERALPGSKGKSAFTLRLDPERHLKLRLVCALNHRSAQQMVTLAVDEFLARQPRSLWDSLPNLKTK